MVIKYKHFLLVFLAMGLFGIAFYLLSIEDKSISRYTYVIFGTFIFQLIVLKIVENKFLSITSMFLFATYLFHFSHLILLNFNYLFESYFEGNLSLYVYGLEFYLEITKIAFIFTYSLFMGMICSNIFVKKGQQIKETRTNQNLAFYFGLTLTLISFPINVLYIFTNRIINMINGGYLSVVGFEVNYLLLLISYLFIPGVFLIVVSNKLSKNKSKTLFLIILIYILVSMLTGLRAYNIITFIILIYLYLRLKRIKLRFRHILLVLIFAFLLGNVMIFIRNNRHEGYTIIQLFVSMFNTKENILFNMMQEFGGTINMFGYVYNNSIEPSNGTQMFSSIVSIFPFMSDIFYNVSWETMTIVERFNTFNIGGTFIADFYFDFGIFGFIFSFLLGFLIRKIDLLVDKLVKHNSIIIISILIPIIVEILFTVRSSTAKLPRMITWYLIIVISIYVFVKLSHNSSNILRLRR